MRKNVIDKKLGRKKQRNATTERRGLCLVRDAITITMNEIP